MALSDDIIITKLAPPVLRQQLVMRDKLLTDVLERTSRRMLLISAGAGFGKTTFMASLFQGKGEQGVWRAWISLDADERNEVHFLKYVIAALEHGGHISTEKAQIIMASQTRDRIRRVMTALINEMAKCDQKITLFLDDYHLVDGPEVNFIIDYLLTRGPANFGLVISSRNRPTLSLSTLKARNELREITDHDLRFSVAEADDFLRIVHHLNLTDDLIMTLQSKTEGWITGLQLVSLILKEKRHEQDLMARVSGNFRDIMDYLTSDVFCHQRVEIQNFLIKSSVLERMNTEVCNWMMNIDNSREILEELEDKNLFIVPLEAEKGWYRYHHLFQDFLRLRLERLQPDLKQELIRKAGEWFLQYGSVTEAVNYAFEARDYDRAVALIEAHAVSFFTHGQMPLLQDWLGRIPPHIARDRFRIPIYFCWALFHMRKPVEAASAVCRAEAIVKRQSQNGQLSGPEQEDIQAELKVLKIGVAITSDNVEKAKKLCVNFLETEPERQDYKTGAMYNMLGYACSVLGEFDQAAKAFATARHCHDLANCPYGMVVADCLMGMNEATMGRLHMAHTLFLQAEEIASKDQIPRSTGVANARLYQACILYEWNKIDEAKELLAANIDLVVECGQAEAPITGLCIYARILHKLGQGEEAWQQLERARNICRDDQLYRLAILTDYEAVCFLLKENNLAQAIVRAGLAAISLDHTPQDIHFDKWDRILCLKLLIKIRLLIAQGEYDHAGKLIDHVLALARDEGRYKRVMECLTLKAICSWQNREREMARQLFEQALDMGREEGYMQIFLKEGKAIIPLLQAVISHRKSAKDDLDYFNLLAAGFDHTAKTCAHKGAGKNTSYLLIEELSRRELDVLSLLAVGESNAEISRQLDIKENTVKWHIKNIFEKLGVNNRTSAALAAQDLKLVF